MPAGGTDGSVLGVPSSCPELLWNHGDWKLNFSIAPQVCDEGHKVLDHHLPGVIISTWVANTRALEDLSASFPSISTLSIPVVKLGTISLMEQSLHKVEDGNSSFQWTLADAVALREKSASVPTVCPVKPQDNAFAFGHPLVRSLSCSFLDHGTTPQLLKQSQISSCSTLSVAGTKLAQQRLNEMENRVSQLAVKAQAATEWDTEIGTNAQVLCHSSKD